MKGSKGYNKFCAEWRKADFGERLKSRIRGKAFPGFEFDLQSPVNPPGSQDYLLFISCMGQKAQRLRVAI